MNKLKMIARHIARSNQTAMPVVQSNLSLNLIPEYVELFRKLDIPVNLYISKTNLVSPVTTIQADPKTISEELKNIIEQTSPENDPQIDDKTREADEFVKSIRPDAINILTNMLSSNEASLSGHDWLAHDIYHVIELKYNPENILEFVEEDVDIEMLAPIIKPVLTWQMAESIFFYWLPKEFKKIAPAYKLNMQSDKVWDLFPDIMIKYLNDPTAPKDVKIEYKPVWVDSLGYLKSRKTDDAVAVIKPKPSADAVQTMVDLMLEDVYNELSSHMYSFIGKVLVLG